MMRHGNRRVFKILCNSIESAEQSGDQFPKINVVPFIVAAFADKSDKCVTVFQASTNMAAAVMVGGEVRSRHRDAAIQ
jgi:hypothetical protein